LEAPAARFYITVTGRHIDQVIRRPALIVDDLAQPLSGDQASAALAAWNQARSRTNVAATPGVPLASAQSETSPAPASAVHTLPVDSGRQPSPRQRP